MVKEIDEFAGFEDYDDINDPADDPGMVKSAVIWMRGFHKDDSVLVAEQDARERGCDQIILKNHNFYDNDDTKKIEAVSVCYTIRKRIAIDYTKAGIEVVKLGPAVNEEAEPPKKRGRPAKQTPIEDMNLEDEPKIEEVA